MKSYPSLLATSRHSVALFALLAGAALAGPGCKKTGLGESLGSPKANLGGQSGSTSVSPSFPTPCDVNLDFGNLPIGLTDSVTVRINNSGSSTLDLLPVSPTLDPEFSLSYGQQAPISPSGFDTFSVTFQPYKVGPVQSSFTIQTDGVNSLCPAPAAGSPGNVITVILTGNGIQLSLVVQPDVLDFGNTLINTTVTRRA